MFAAVMALRDLMFPERQSLTDARETLAFLASSASLPIESITSINRSLSPM